MPLGNNNPLDLFQTNWNSQTPSVVLLNPSSRKSLNGRGYFAIKSVAR
jgi:hypothetical protein